MFRLLANITAVLSITLLLTSAGHGAGGVACERWLAERAAGDWFVRGQWVLGFSAEHEASALGLLDRVDGRCVRQPDASLATVMGTIAT